MLILVVQFSLRDLSMQDYLALTQKVAPEFVGIPGLVSKTWVANAHTGRVGGVYVWERRSALDAYLRSPLYQRIERSPNFVEIEAMVMDVLDAPTAVTGGAALERIA